MFATTKINATELKRNTPYIYNAAADSVNQSNTLQRN
jgi:hypothetical protein